MKMAYVEWEDAADIDDAPWAVHEDEGFTYTPVLVNQVGYLLYDGPEGVVLTSAYIEGGTVGCRTQIPRGMVRKMTVANTND